jgi:PKD repeat protein
MKKSPLNSGFLNSRNLLGVLLSVAGIACAMLTFASAAPSKQTTAGKQPTAGVKPAASQVPNAPTPTSATLTSANIGSTKALNYADSVGSIANLTFFAGSGTCAVPMSCSTFTLTIDPSVRTASPGYDPSQYNIFIELSWQVAAIDYDTWVCSGSGNCVQANVVASNASTGDPETIFLPAATTAPGTYTINAVNTTGAPEAYNGTVYLQPIPTATTCPTCPVPRYQTYYAPNNLAPNGAGEPSIGVDWNPNVPSLKVTAPGTLAHGPTLLNTGGVTFFQASFNTLQVGFDDCASPAFNTWTDKTPSTLLLSLDPIGFVDHYSSAPLGIAYPPPATPGRVFNVQLNAGNSEEAFSDNDGNSYTPGEGGSPPAGPDHETLGGGPYSTQGVGGVAPPHPTYANAIYYCSQNIVAEAECSRSDDGGLTFGPGIPIYNPTQCTGSIHGHVKVAPNGTVYVPNSSCGFQGAAGVAISLDNGITWNSSGVLNSTGSQDPSVGIGQNNVGKPLGGTTPANANTVYLGWVSGDGHPHIAHSPDQGATWLDDTDVGASVVNVDGTTGIRHAVFPVVVAGDDNRASYGFIGTGPGISTDANPCDPYGATLNCANIWHAYIATTYDGGKNWRTIDTTPNKAMQKGTICLQGTFCAGGRNLLDFNDFTVDSQGRGLMGYADGVGATGNNTFDGQSGGALPAVARQSGGKRLFSFFDITEPHAPAPPQALSDNRVTGGILVAWRTPDNGGSPITGYNIYRGTSSGGENTLTPVGQVTGETTNEFLDNTVTASGNYFYHITAVNALGQSGFCNEPGIAIVGGGGSPCAKPYVNVDAAGGAGNVPTDPTTGEMTIQGVNIGEPFTSCSDNSLTFVMKVQTMDPGGTGMATPVPNGEWQILFNITDTNGNPETIFVDMDTNGIVPTPEFSYGRRDPSTTGGTLDTTECTAGTASTCPAISGMVSPDGTITIKLNVATPIVFNAPTAGATGATFSWDGHATGTRLTSITGDTLLLVGGAGTGLLETIQSTSGGSYTRVGNASCQTNPPIAALTANPLSGSAPLAVSFDATTSHEPTGACGTINSYTIDFGDGSATVTNSTGTFSHTYTTPGDYPAKLKVKDSAGLTSTNAAQVVITVNTSGPPLTGVVSRMIHGTAGTFDVQLFPLINGKRGVECRSSSTLGAGNYQLVFGFTNSLTSVTGASVTSGSGSVSSSMINSANPQQYIVNLTGVANQQYVVVTLTGVHDSAGNTGSVVGPQMGVLVADVNGTGVVDSGDVFLARQQTGKSPSSSSFREDVNASGVVDSGDVFITRQHTATGLPTPP